MSKLRDALEIRDQAFFFARDRESMDRCGNKLSLRALDEFFGIAFHDRSFSGREEWGCDIWFTPGGFSNTGEGRGFKCLSVVWNARHDYQIINFKRGAWEDMCLALNNGAYNSAEKGAQSASVDDLVRRLLHHANQDPAAYLRKQNGIVIPIAVNTPRLFGINRRHVNLDDAPLPAGGTNETLSKDNLIV